VKSPFELALTAESGRLHDQFLTEIAPALLTEGMTEAEFVGDCFRAALRLGYQGISRFARFQTEMVMGQAGFGESALCPTSFDGPGGARGMYPAVPLVGSRERRLKKGDLVFADLSFGVGGYHTDKTQVYSFGAAPSAEAARTHKICLEIEKRAAAMLRPGARPSEIYDEIMRSETLPENFMGFGARRVKFLGHGAGLHIDEYPALAKGFDEPLAENMTIALEPKAGIADAGMVGVEDTYLVTKDGGKALTGGGREIIVV
jgi:Xaa-Pro aminopeptidase